jgi:hypothetical protein
MTRTSRAQTRASRSGGRIGSASPSVSDCWPIFRHLGLLEVRKDLDSEPGSHFTASILHFFNAVSISNRLPCVNSQKVLVAGIDGRRIRHRRRKNRFRQLLLKSVSGYLPEEFNLLKVSFFKELRCALLGYARSRDTSDTPPACTAPRRLY